MQRVRFECPASHYVQIYSGQRGGGGVLPTFHGHLGHQRGYGFLSFLSKTVVPLLQRFVLPHALRFGKNVLADVSTGEPTNLGLRTRAALKTHGINAVRSAGRDVVEHVLTGTGKRRKKTKAKRKAKKTAAVSESLLFAPSRKKGRHPLVGGGCAKKKKKKKSTKKGKAGGKKKRLSKSAKATLALAHKYPSLS
jgi:hypothetical protein